MYDIPQHKSRIRLMSSEGDIFEYANYDEFIEGLNYWFVEERVVTTFRDWPERWVYLGKELVRYIVRDEYGSVITKNDILDSIRQINRSKRTEWCLRRENFVYRHSPVPYTGSKRYRRYFKNYYKLPKTTQELRRNEAYKEFVRGKRTKNWLPTAWEDRVRSDIRTRKNWKSRRKTQWK